MPQRSVIVELKHTQSLETASFGFADSMESIAPSISGISLDTGFTPVQVPKISKGIQPEGNLFDMTADILVDSEPSASTYIVRGTIEEADIEKAIADANSNDNVVGIYSDVSIEPMAVCPSGAMGTDADVERLLCVNKMREKNMDGSGVLVAIVDSGVNMAYLNSRGKTPNFDAARSWSWNPATVTPGSASVGHGTMCAFDACIAAPRCTLLDIALLRPLSAPPGGSLMSGLLSDAIRAYNHLLAVMTAPSRPGEHRSMVVNNSWGMFHSSWDFPVGHPGNYSDNPNHPFTRLVATLERAGADILFAAGNCGPGGCTDGRCSGITSNNIYGANSSAAVTCVGGVVISKDRVGYSSVGPGRLVNRKPDITCYTHFRGSGVYAADGGTSAATPVLSGVVAAIRTVKPYSSTDPASSPSAIRNLITTTAEDAGPTGYDYEFGYGIVNGCKIVTKLFPRIVPEIDRRLLFCLRYPSLCRLYDFCKRRPHICRRLGVREPDILSLLHEISDSDTSLETLPDNIGEGTMESSEDELVSALMELLQGKENTAPSKGCGCGCKS